LKNRDHDEMGVWGGAWVGLRSEPQRLQPIFQHSLQRSSIRIIVMKLLVHYWLSAEYTLLVWPQQQTLSITLVASPQDEE